MSELAQAVEERITAALPEGMPPFAELRRRRRSRQLARTAICATVVAVVGLSAAVAVQADGTSRVSVGPVTDSPTATASPSATPTTLADEFARLVFAPESERVWQRDGRAVPLETLSLSTGPEHCDLTKILFLGVGAAVDPGGPLPSFGYVRAADPGGAPARDSFLSPASLPADAADTGYRLGEIELWLARSDMARYAYLVNAANRADVERWPAVTGLCA